MNQFINRLPIEIVHHILSYSYNPQPIKLQQDIISYVKNKMEIIEIFKRRYNITKIEYHLSFHMNSYLVGLPNIYINCKNQIEEVCKRLWIWNRVLAINKINVNQRFSHYILWGLLTIEEREEFTKIQKKMDETRMP